MAAEVNEAERGNAQKALALLDSFAKRGDDLQQSLDKFISMYTELTKDFRQLEALGYAPTTWALVKVNMQAAVATGLQFTDLRQAFLAPHERRDFRAVIEGWARHIRGRAEARLTETRRAKRQLERIANGISKGIAGGQIDRDVREDRGEPRPIAWNREA